MPNYSSIMQLGNLIKKVREAKELSQKEVAMACGMDKGQYYSRIDNGKTDPAFSAVVRIAQGLEVELAELFKGDLLKEPNSYDRSLMEKVALIDRLTEDQKKSIFTFIDLAIANKRMKDSLRRSKSDSLMDKQKTLEVLEALAGGVDPVSGEVSPPDSPYQNVEVVRALFHAISLIKDGKSKKDGPARVGKPWDDQEDQQLMKAFLNHTSISELAKSHQRTSGAIRSRLQKIGLVDEQGNRIE